MQYLEVEDAILFPFGAPLRFDLDLTLRFLGMGAFLRHLNLNDNQYEVRWLVLNLLP